MLTDLAAQNRIPIEATVRRTGVELVVPSVIHWKQNHYAAITERRGDFYLVHDPTFGSAQWLRGTVINEEASGYFLTPAGRRPEGYGLLSRAECESIYGRGMNIEDPPPAQPPCPEEGEDPCDCPSPPPPPSPSGSPGSPPSAPSDSSCGDCKVSIGMPTWKVTEPYISSWLYDQPMSYRTTSGSEFALKLTYHQRETRPADGAIFNFGPYWNCNWLTYLDVTDIGDDAQFNYYYATLLGARGGERLYRFDLSGPEHRSRTRLERIEYASTFAGFRIIYPNGSQAIYGLLVEVSASPMQTLALLSARIDPQGRTTQFLYSTNNNLVRLEQVIDSDDRTNFVRYASAYTTSVTEIESPSGQLAQFTYDADGLLTNIVDAAGISSSFAYAEMDDVFVLNQLITPYGPTTFDYLRPTAGLYDVTENDDINRAITVTQPDGGKHLFMYRDNSANLIRNSEWVTMMKTS